MDARLILIGNSPRDFRRCSLHKFCQCQIFRFNVPSSRCRSCQDAQDDLTPLEHFLYLLPLTFRSGLRDMPETGPPIITNTAVAVIISALLRIDLSFVTFTGCIRAKPCFFYTDASRRRSKASRFAAGDRLARYTIPTKKPGGRQERPRNCFSTHRRARRTAGRCRQARPLCLLRRDRRARAGRRSHGGTWRR